MNLGLKNASVKYYKSFVETQLGIDIFEDLKKIFEDEEIKRVLTRNGDSYKLNRKTLVFVNSELTSFTIPKIWGTHITVHKFTDKLLKLKQKIENELNYEFNICLANYYVNEKKILVIIVMTKKKGILNVSQVLV